MWLYYAYLLLISCVILAGILRYNRITPGQKWLLLLLALSLPIEVFSMYAVKHKLPNLHILNLYIVLELLILFKVAEQESLISIRDLNTLALLNVSFAGINSVLLQDFFKIINFNTFIFGAFCLVTLILILLHKYLSMDIASPIWKFPVFWILSAHGLYYISSLLHFGLYNYYRDIGNEKRFQFLENINLSLNYVLYILLFFSFFVHQNLVSRDVSK